MTYAELMERVTALKGKEGVDSFPAGRSTLGEELVGYHIGSYAGPQIFIEGGIHAREYPSTLVVVGMLEYLAEKNITTGGIYSVPLTNPDGARLVLDGSDFIKCPKLKDYVDNVNDGSADFSQWKADIWAVDLNVNFDALWGGGAQNVFCPAPANFVGFYPDSEREVRELINLTYRINPALTLSYHTKGNVIYYGFEVLSESQIQRDLRIAEEISAINGYEIVKTERSTGGYSDFVSLDFGVPAYTIEVGDPYGPTPISLDEVPRAIELNRDVPIRLLEILNADGAESGESVENGNTDGGNGGN